MNINRTQGYGTNFKSDVYITSNVIENYREFELLGDEKFQQELDKLRNNGNNDTVLLRSITHERGLQMFITEKDGNSIKYSQPGPVYRAGDVPRLYKEGKEKDMKYSDATNVPEAVVDYLI